MCPNHSNEYLRLFDEDVEVRARVHTINGFSAHAGRSELLGWLHACGRVQRVFLVHGDFDTAMQSFADELQRLGIVHQIPGAGEPILLR